MTKNTALSRPAMSAIAAFLVLSTPGGAMAQEAPAISMTPPVAMPAPQTPPTVADPAPAPPTASPQAAQPSTPAPAIRVPLDIAAEAAEAEAAAPPAATAAPTERPAPRARSAAPAPAAADAQAVPEATPAAVPAQPDPMLVEEAVPAPAPVMAPAEPVMEAIAPAEGNAFPWEIAGGIAALLIVGGTGLAFARRRRANTATPVGYETVTAPVDPAAPIVATPDQAVIAAPAVPAPRPAPRPAPIAPQGSMGRHEAMAIAGPSPDNPFATLKKRLKRARFLDRQERTVYAATLAEQKDMRRKPVSAWEIAQREVPAPAEQDVRRPEPGPGRSGDLRPGWLRN